MTTSRLRLHFNENTAGCSPAVIDALRTLTAEDIATYPDYDAITAKVAAWLGVDAGSVLLTNGLDEGLYAVSQAGVQGRHEVGPYAPVSADIPAGRHEDGPYASEAPGGPDEMDRRGRPRVGPCQFIQTDPTFEMFEAFTRIVGADLVRIAPDMDFAFPLARVLGTITPATRVIYLVDPNNPTGLPLPDGAAETIAAAAPDAIVFVDEAYADFSGRTLIGPALARHANLVVGRTFAKGHGLAGLRIGALVARPDTIERLRRVTPPFSVNIAAVRALEAALADDAYLSWYVAQAAASRTMIADFCHRRGLTHWPSAGNFVLVRVGPDASAITRALAARGIDIRDKSTAPGCDGCLRLTAGVVAHTERLITDLEDILASRTN